MLIKALLQYYKSMAKKGRLPLLGWCNAKAAFALELNEAGELVTILPLKTEQTRGKKVVEVPQIHEVPEQVKRSSGIAAQFLCDNAGYILGLYDAKTLPDDDKKRQKVIQRSQDSFKACADKHLAVLQSVETPVAQSVKNFFKNWSVETAHEHDVVQCWADELLKGGNCLFFVNGVFAQQDPAIRQAWEKYITDSRTDVPIMQCAVTGQYLPVARLHPVIKGVVDAQSSGASLVSFNAPAYDSYGRDGEQGLNAPVSEGAAFAYTTALNYLLADTDYVYRISDTMLVSWSEDADTTGQMILCGALGKTNVMDNNTLYSIIASWEKGKAIKFEQTEIPYDNRFYILGIAPNAARLAVRFFLQDSFGNFIKHLKEHFERLQIEGPPYAKGFMTLVDILNETVNQNSRDKKPLPILTGSTLRAILTGSSYPAALYQQVLIRLKAEAGNVNYYRAAIIKAYLLKNAKHKWEGLTVSLNETTNEKPYVLGRLFALLEHLQQAAHTSNNKELNTTIKNRYFNSACDNPASVFPVLEKLANHHLAKLSAGNKVFFEKQIGELMDKLPMEMPVLPRTFSLEEQGVFILGYYHQNQKRYAKKEENENG